MLLMMDPFYLLKFLNHKDECISPRSMRAAQRDFIYALKRANPNVSEYVIAQKLTMFSLKLYVTLF